MARISGVDLPKNKRIEIALTYIYGIGKPTSQSILKDAGIDFNKKTQNLIDEEIIKIKNAVEKHKVEGDLKKEVTMNIKRLMDIGAYRGLRHRRSLPVKGQRTHTNARTRKGPRGSIMSKKRGG